MIKEASRFIEPGLGEPPQSEYHKAQIAHQHSLKIAPSAREHQRMLDTASLRNDTETYMRLEMERVARVRRHEENDGSLQDAIVRSFRAEVDLPRDIVRRAKLLNVRLIPPRGVSLDEPDETWFLDQAGFEKICEAILSLSEPVECIPEVSVNDGAKAAVPSGQSRPGPKPGSVNRYAKADRALFPEIEKLMQKGLSMTGACGQLADEGRITGIGTQDSRAKRLRDRFNKVKSSGSSSHFLPLTPKTA